MPHAVTTADPALREVCSPLIRVVSDDGDAAIAEITADDLARLKDVGEKAKGNTPLRRAVAPFLGALRVREGQIRLDPDAVTRLDWLALKRADARADALQLTAASKQAVADERLFTVAQRFAGAVYNDNGDVTLSTSWVHRRHWIELRDALPGARADHPVRKIAQTFVRCLIDRDGQTIIDENKVTISDWVTIRNAVIYR